MIKLSSTADHPLDDTIQWQRYTLFNQEVRPRMWAAAGLSLLVGLLFSTSAAPVALLCWFVGLIFVGLNSWVILERYRERPPAASKLGRWHVANLYLAFIWGVYWAAAPWLFFNDASQAQILALLVLVVLMSAIPSVTMGAYPDIYLAFLAPAILSFSLQLIRQPNPQHWLVWLIGPLALVLLAVFSLMSHRKQLEFIRLRVEHQQAQAQAEQAVAEKNRFIAAASHDLRQPLQAAALYTGLLRQEDAPANDGALINRLDDSIRTVNDLLTRLFDLSALDSGSITPQHSRFDLKHWLEMRLQRFLPLAEHRGLQLRLEAESTWVETDAQMLSQIVSNLLDNALKYTQSGEVLIRLTTTANDCYLSVIDTGPGIAPQHQEQIFDEFYRIRASYVTESKGFGLGLAIVARLCQRLAIELRLESLPGRGSCFELKLPQVPAQSTETQAEVETEQPPALRVLLVEDDATVIDALSSTLVSWDCDVWTAESATALTQYLNREPSFDVLITDDELDNETRSEHIIAQVRAKQAKLPCLILTGNTHLQSRPEWEMERIELLHKPVQPDQLIAALNRLVPTRL